jgi:hypothetical protein
MATSKRVKLNVNVLLEWVYDSDNQKNQNYQIISNINEGSKGFVSTAGLNTINNNLFTIDSVLKKYSKIDLNKYNFLQKQDFSGNLIPYDKVKIYFPIDYNFPVYRGFNLKIYTLDYTNTNLYNISNYYYDKTLDTSVGTLDLITPFMYDEKEWGKCITLEIPSIFNIAKDRIVTNVQNTVIPNTINYNLTNGVGLSQSAPIFIDFSFIVTGEVILDTLYYYLGDTYETSVPQQPEYQSLGVKVEESSQGDYFEIYGIYNNTNELIDNFVADLEAKGKKIEIEYVVTLYEEGIVSGFPQTFVVTENFSQKILYRPIIRFSNTTAAIDVTMNIIDIVDNSQIERFASIGITKSIFKYGKTLSRINLDNSVIKPKIYKAAPENIIMNMSGNNTKSETTITKVPYPVLYDKYKILVNSTSSVNNDFKSNGLLNIIITPFDTVIKFTIAKEVDTKSGDPVPYDLSQILTNANLKIVFKSDTKSLEKDYFAQSNDNNLKNGIIVYKINESDLGVVKEIYNKGFKNFYLTLKSENINNLLYSGKYEFYENIKFIDIQSTTKQSTTSGTTSNNNSAELYKKEIDALNTTYNKTIDQLNETIKKLEIDKSVLSNSQFKKSNVPFKKPNELIKDNKSYFNILIFVKKNISLNSFQKELNELGIKSWIYNDHVYYIGSVHILIIKKIENLKTYIKTVIKINIYDGQNQGKSNNSTITTDQVKTAINENLSQLNKSLGQKSGAKKIKYLDPDSGQIIENNLDDIV